jgi:hypothetical protein
MSNSSFLVFSLPLIGPGIAGILPALTVLTVLCTPIDAFAEQSTCCHRENADIGADTTEAASLRISRPTHCYVNHFTTFEPGFSYRWFRNLRNPSFCTMVLCHGSCSKPTRSATSPSNLGMPPANAHLPECAGNAATPCGLKDFSQILMQLSNDK